MEEDQEDSKGYYRFFPPPAFHQRAILHAASIGQDPSVCLVARILQKGEGPCWWKGGYVGGKAPFFCMDVYEHEYMDVYEHE